MPIQPLSPQVVIVGMIVYDRRHLATSAEGVRNPAGRTDAFGTSQRHTDVQCSLDRCIIDAARIMCGTGSM